MERWERELVQRYLQRQMEELDRMRLRRLRLRAQDRLDEENARLHRGKGSRRRKVSEFVISEERLKTARRVLIEKGRELDLNQQLDIADEVRWSDQVELNSRGDKINLALTDLQLVMLAAGVAAVAEMGGAVKEGEGAVPINGGDDGALPF